MMKVLDVGQCSLDHGTIKRVVESLGASVVRAHTLSDASLALSRETFALVLVNRVIDADGADGMRLLDDVQALPDAKRPPIMLVSNFPEKQEEAIRRGAIPGFGKASIHAAETLERLRAVLHCRAAE